MQEAEDGVSFKNISATTATFNLLGGRYYFSVIATGSGSITLEIQGPDGSTFVTAATAVTATGAVVVELPPGLYKFVIVTLTAIYIQLARIPTS